MPHHHGQSGTSAGVQQGQSSSGGNGYKNVHETGAVSQTPGRTGGTNLGSNVNRDLMSKQQRKQFESRHGLGKVGLPNWGIVGTLAKEYDIRKTHGKTSEKTEHKGLRQDLRTGAYYHKAPKHRPIIDRGGNGEGGTQMATTSAQAAQPIKPAMKPYYMGFDFQQAKHKLGTSGQLMPDPGKQTYQGWQFKKGGLSGGERFGPPPKKGPDPHGKCPFRPDGIRGVGAVEKGRGVKFIGTK
tara:strand:- start:38 stop:757 length:720 start_codon:yes stop_codon:yes gene_type:complete